MANFHELRIADVRQETNDTVSIAFDIPQALTADFAYEAGQYISLDVPVNGNTERRSYSLCSSPQVDVEHRIAVKRVEGGKVSNYLNESVKAGDMLSVSTPEGTFVSGASSGRIGSYVFITGGSGITPVISILKSVLALEPQSRCTLFYVNRNEDSVIFKNELEALQAANSDRFIVHNVFTQPKDKATSEQRENGMLLTGRPDRKKILVWFNQLIELGVDHDFFLCGPNGLMEQAQMALETIRVPKDQIHFEYFSTPDADEADEPTGEEQDCTATILLDDEEFEISIPKGTTVLDAALKADVDAPYSCRGGVCSSCVAKVNKGSVNMRMNYTLTDEEVKEGFILTCQSVPTCASLEVDYDA